MKKISKKEALKVIKECYQCYPNENYWSIKLKLLKNGLDNFYLLNHIKEAHKEKHKITIENLNHWDDRKELYYRHGEKELEKDILEAKMFSLPHWYEVTPEEISKAMKNLN